MKATDTYLDGSLERYIVAGYAAGSLRRAGAGHTVKVQGRRIRTLRLQKAIYLVWRGLELRDEDAWLQQPLAQAIARVRGEA